MHCVLALEFVESIDGFSDDHEGVAAVLSPYRHRHLFLIFHVNLSRCSRLTNSPCRKEWSLTPGQCILAGALASLGSLCVRLREWSFEEVGRAELRSDEWLSMVSDVHTNCGKRNTCLSMRLLAYLNEPSNSLASIYWLPSTFTNVSIQTNHQLCYTPNDFI